MVANATKTNIKVKGLVLGMYQELFQSIGLSTNEAKVYEALLHLGQSSVQKISVKSKVHRRNVYDSLHKLMERGLVTEIFVRGEKNFKAINPSRLLDIVREKEERIARLLPDMQKLYGSAEDMEEAYIYKGVEGVKNYLRDILKTRETVYFIGAKGMWLDPRLQHFLPQFQRERERLGIKFKHIFDYEVKEKLPGILKFVGKPYKFLPKEYSSPTMVDIFGDYVVTFISGGDVGKLPDEPIQFVVKSRTLADGYRKFFQFMWDFCPEEKKEKN